MTGVSRVVIGWSISVLAARAEEMIGDLLWWDKMLRAAFSRRESRCYGGILRSHGGHDETGAERE